MELFGEAQILRCSDKGECSVHKFYYYIRKGLNNQKVKITISEKSHICKTNFDLLNR